LSDGVFPSEWKYSFITPIHKKKSKENISNYRPIAKLSCIGKVFEKLLTDNIFETIKDKIMPQQHGFFKQRSTQTNLAYFSDFLHTHVDVNLQVDVLYTDFEKAFDKINLTKLLEKLKKIGIGGKLLEFMKSYLSDRKMRVILNGCFSREFTATSGVPQRSHLGPLFFIIYLNDIADIFKSSKFIAYVDDPKIWKVVNDEKDSVAL
jgi:hypothetical protein